MAKRAKVALNVLVTEETREAIRKLANDLELAQGEVIDWAVRLFRGTAEIEGVKVARWPPEGDFIKPPVVPAPSVGDLVEKGLLSQGMPEKPPVATITMRCDHCGKQFESESKRNITCEVCAENGHVRDRYTCEQCRVENIP